MSIHLNQALVRGFLGGVSLFAASTSAVGCGGSDTSMLDGQNLPNEKAAEVSKSRRAPTLLQRRAATDHLRRYGFDVGTLSFDNDGTVDAEGDMVFNVDELLKASQTWRAQGYANVAAQYFMPMDLWLAVHPAAPISDEWLIAFFLAAVDWSNSTEFNFHFDGQNPEGRTVWLAKFALANEGSDDREWCKWAQANAPLKSHDLGPYPIGKVAPGPGATIIVNEAWNGKPGLNCSADPYCGSPIGSGDPIERLPADQKVKIAAHEIGHALGLMHPGATSEGAVHLPGTAVATAPGARNYSSVMWTGCIASNSPKTLSSDDIACANLIALVP